MQRKTGQNVKMHTAYASRKPCSESGEKLHGEVPRRGGLTRLSEVQDREEILLD